MMNSYTRLYAVFGKPVRHSKSPAIHNFAFRHHGINAAYLAFEIDDIKKGIEAVKTLNIQGASITIPFKESIMNYLDRIDEEALSIGAVNTLINKEGKLEGYNTDHAAALEPLKPFGIKGKKVCIIGAGGAARAIAFGISKEKGQLLIINRDPNKGEKLAEKYQADFIPLNDSAGDKNRLKSIQADILINTTPLGMSPNINETPLETPFPAKYLKPGTIVMDIVYTPVKTRLLTEAESQGCTIIDGLSMFLHQGAAQFRLWTEIKPDIELLRNVL
jgi:shikimate dehydrogenase